MSTINDALREAGKGQAKDAPPEAGPGLRAVELPARPDASQGYLLPALIVVVMIISAVMMWQWFRGGSGELKVRARSAESAAGVITAQPVPVATTAPLPVEVKPLTATAVEEKDLSNTAAAVETPKPAPITYKLQGIIYQPNHCSAVINGKTVMAGERVAEARVISIDKDTATIVTSAGQTNVLELP